jgi:nucleotide-binding universal stress UspA family protein
MTDHRDGYQHIVVALDGGAEAWAAFDEAARLARSSNGRLDILVADPDAPNDGRGRSARHCSHVAETAVARASDVPATAFVVNGEPASAIVEHADREHCDLIVMGCRSRLGSHPATSASTTTAVSDHTRVPVLLVRQISGDANA